MKYCLCTYADAIYFDGAVVMIYSFLKNNKWFDGDIIIYFVEDLLPESNRNLLKALYYKIVFKEINESEFNEVYNRVKNVSKRRFGKNVFYWYSCLKEDYDKILYLDADTLIINDIKDFFDSNSFCCGVPSQVKLDPVDIHKRNNETINSGVLLFNKTNNDLFGDLINFSKSCTFTKKWSGKYPDQDVINLWLLDKDVTCFPKYYNNCYCHINNSIDVNKDKIVHFVGSNKPWYDGYKYNRELWLKYKNELWKP